MVSPAATAGAVKADRGTIIGSYQESGELAAVFDLVHAVPTDEEFLTGYSGTSEFVLADRAGATLRAARLPSGGRPSISGALRERLKGDAVPYGELISASAPIRLVQEHGADNVVVVHPALGHAGGENMGTAFWVSLLRKDLAGACMGPLMPLESVGQPVFRARGDTLVSVQRLWAADGDAQTTIDKWLIESMNCSWESLDLVLNQE